MEKDFFKLVNNGFFGKTLEDVRNRLKIEFTENCGNDRVIKQQSKLTFNGIHKSYANYRYYTLKQNEVLMN